MSSLPKITEVCKVYYYMYGSVCESSKCEWVSKKVGVRSSEQVNRMVRKLILEFSVPDAAHGARPHQKEGNHCGVEPRPKSRTPPVLVHPLLRLRQHAG